MDDLLSNEVVVGDSQNVDLTTLVAVARHGAPVSLEPATQSEA